MRNITQTDVVSRANIYKIKNNRFYLKVWVKGNSVCFRDWVGRGNQWQQKEGAVTVNQTGKLKVGRQALN